MPTSFGLYKAFKFSELVEPAIQYSDYFMFNFDVSDGSDLDIVFKFLTPNIDAYIGWGKQSTISIGSNTFAYWGGDNTGLGSESVYIDKAKLLSAFPGTTQIEVDLRAFWYGSVGTNPVVVSMDGFQGGSMVKDGFTFINPTATNSFPSSRSFTNIITTQSNSSDSLGQRVARAVINLNTKTINYFAT